MDITINNEIRTISEQLTEEINAVSTFIFTHPEIGDEEYESSSFLASVLKKHGFQVEYPYGNIPTSFRAEFGNGNGPKIAFLSEYDALPGYGSEKKPAHACGHNWISASTLGAALILSKLTKPINGTIVVIGTPAEETVGRKVDLLKCGAFDDISAVFQMHLNSKTNINVYALAIDSWQFEFFGKSSHAAKVPFNGINALDAVNLTFAGISALRQQLKSDVRIHGIVSAGGETPNIIPSYAACKFYVRSTSRDYLDVVSEKVKNCARGAALMTGAKLTITQFENSFHNLQVNQNMKRIMKKNLEKAGIINICDTPELIGSTDIGNVSYKVPTFYCEIGVGDGIATIHEESFLKYVDSEEAHEKLLKAVCAFAWSGYEVFSDEKLLNEITREFNKTGGQ